MKEIPLLKGGVALVDDEDYEFLCQFRWGLSGGYAITQIYFTEPNGMENRQPVTMHRLLMGSAINGNCIDHINRNRLDNRRSNLRIISRKQNYRNSVYYDEVTARPTKYITYREANDKYQVFIGRKHYGYFKRLEDAVKHRDSVLAQSAEIV